jgi:uncharacterized protein YjdB
MRVGLLSLLAFSLVGCPYAMPDFNNPNDPEGSNYSPAVTIDVIAVALVNTGTMTLELGSTLRLGATQAPANANTGLSWSSSDDTIATVADGLVTPVKLGTITITVASILESSISSSCTVVVIAAGASVDTGNWKLANLAKGNTIAATTSTTIPPFINGVLTLQNGNTGGFANAGITNSSILYYNQTLTGDFVIRARVRLASAVSASTGLGIAVGAFEAPTTGTFAASTKIVTMMGRTGNGGNRCSYYTKVTGNGTGSPVELGTDTPMGIERVFEVKRLAASGYVVNLYETDGTSLVGTTMIVWNDDATLSESLSTSVLATSPVVAGIALTGAVAEIANVSVATLDSTGAETALFSSPSVAASASGVTVSGPTGYADSYYDTLANAQASIITLTAAVHFSGVSTKTVTWSSSDTSVATVAASSDTLTGIVTPLKTGTTRITVTSVDGGFSDSYAMEFTETKLLVSDITLAGDSSVMAGCYVPLVATISGTSGAIPTDSSLSWTSSDTSIATVSASSAANTERVSGIAAGSAIITAAANDGGGSSKTFNVKVTTASNAIWSWTAGVDPDFDLTEATSTLSGIKLVRGAGTVAGSTTGINLATARFNVGSVYTNIDIWSTVAGSAFQATTDSLNVPDGQFNFTKKATVTIAYNAYTGTTYSGFVLYLNNNTTSDNATTTPLYQAADPTATPVLLKISSKLIPNSVLVASPSSAQTAVYTIDPVLFTRNTDTLAHAFLQFRTGSSASINITSISIAYAP